MPHDGHTLRLHASERRRPVSAAARRSPHPKPYSDQELRDCQKDKETSGLEVFVPDEGNLMHWKGTLKGPTGTPYEGGVFKIDIQLPSDYPFVPPKVRRLGGRPHTHRGAAWGRVALPQPTEPSAAASASAAHCRPRSPLAQPLRTGGSGCELGARAGSRARGVAAHPNPNLTPNADSYP